MKYDFFLGFTKGFIIFAPPFSLLAAALPICYSTLLLGVSCRQPLTDLQFMGFHQQDYLWLTHSGWRWHL